MGKGEILQIFNGRLETLGRYTFNEETALFDSKMT